MNKFILDEIDKKEIGRRLATARRQRHMTQQQAADIVGLTRTTMVAIEKGERRVRPEELVTFAEVYEREIADFVRPYPSMQPAIAQFRGPTYKTDEDLEKIAPHIEKLEELARNYLELEQMLGQSMRHKYPSVVPPAQLTTKTSAEAVAIGERNRLGLGDGPLPILRDLLEQEVGLRIFYFPMTSATGFSEIYFYSETLGGCIAINSDHPEERRRWSLAHAYGHFLGHRYLPSITLDDDNVPESEVFADRFAAYFLMPTSSLTRTFSEMMQGQRNPTMADLFRLANYYGVSLSAITLRLEDMGFLPSGAANRLKRRKVKVADAYQELGLSAIAANSEVLPRRYLLLAIKALLQGIVSEGQFAYLLGLDLVRARRIAEAMEGLDFGETLTHDNKPGVE
jgi:Zn-dependent peptidase ImmA (M78 family)/DNA-binding XRE family transcriptional regulator